MENELLQFKIRQLCKEFQKEAIQSNQESWGLSDLHKNLYTFFVYNVYRLRIITAEECKAFIKDIDIHTYNVICDVEIKNKEGVANASVQRQEN